MAEHPPPRALQNLRDHMTTHRAARADLFAQIDSAVAAAAQELSQERSAQNVARPDFQPKPTPIGDTTTESTEQP